MKLSIITINLNNRDGLTKTIESVAKQTFKDFEYIIIDGGSTDRSVEVLKDSGDKITHWISESDTGIYNAMNKGIRAAKGEYLQFLNSGDCLAGDSVLDNVFKNELTGGIVYTEGYLINSGKMPARISLPSTIDLLYLIDNSICHPGSFIPKDIFINIGLYNENFKIISDTEFFIIAFLKGYHYQKIDLSSVIIDANGISRTDHNLIKEEKRKMITEIFGQEYYELYSDRLNISARLEFLKKSDIIRFFLKHMGNFYINKLFRII